DFFLDRYLLIDPLLAEVSVETGLTAHQVVDVRATPGAAGTVTANLRALGLQVTALGTIGDDGEGYELRRALRAGGVNCDHMVATPDRRTPTYTKPPVQHAGALPRELERLDIRTRTPLANHIRATLAERLTRLAPQVDLLIVADQMPEAEAGVVTSELRAALALLAEQLPQLPILADSRERIGLFHGLIIKPNLAEARRATALDDATMTPHEQAAAAGRALLHHSRRPVFVTLGADGILVIEPGTTTHVAAPAVDGPIDIVGAGDSAMAAIAAALAAGATPAEAALLGNLAAAVTIRQLGTTGTASQQQIVAQWEQTA
ncbi:MAG TPA: PfkB family carbohydrate kinase, partial [Roseiflexaceae bacterium]|nr:PfkB family carbohydrate kinase [Roseiflexaceae bacterium]